MTRDMGVNLAKYSIRVNALCPGFAYTNLTKSITDDETVHKKLIELHPMGRLGTADDIANAALFLVSSSSITSASLETTLPFKRSSFTWTFLQSFVHDK